MTNEFEFNINLDDEHPPMMSFNEGVARPEDVRIESESIYCFSTCGKRSSNFDQVNAYLI